METDELIILIVILGGAYYIIHNLQPTTTSPSTSNTTHNFFYNIGEDLGKSINNVVASTVNEIENTALPALIKGNKDKWGNVIEFFEAPSLFKINPAPAKAIQGIPDIPNKLTQGLNTLAQLFS